MEICVLLVYGMRFRERRKEGRGGRMVEMGRMG